MKKGIIYIVLLIFVSSFAVSCSSNKAQCGAYAKEDVKTISTEASI